MGLEMKLKIADSALKMAFERLDEYWKSHKKVQIYRCKDGSQTVYFEGFKHDETSIGLLKNYERIMKIRDRINNLIELKKHKKHIETVLENKYRELESITGFFDCREYELLTMLNTASVVGVGQKIPGA